MTETIFMILTLAFNPCWKHSFSIHRKFFNFQVSMSLLKCSTLASTSALADPRLSAASTLASSWGSKRSKLPASSSPRRTPFWQTNKWPNRQTNKQTNKQTNNQASSITMSAQAHKYTTIYCIMAICACLGHQDGPAIRRSDEDNWNHNFMIYTHFLMKW